MNFGHDMAQVSTAHLLAQPQQKLQLDSKIRITHNVQKNGAVLKSTHQGIKEVTFIQEGLRRGDVQGGEEVQRHGDVEREVPHPHVVDKNQEGYLRSEGSQLHTRQPRPGF